MTKTKNLIFVSLESRDKLLSAIAGLGLCRTTVPSWSLWFIRHTLVFSLFVFIIVFPWQCSPRSCSRDWGIPEPIDKVLFISTVVMWLWTSRCCKPWVQLCRPLPSCTWCCLQNYVDPPSWFLYSLVVGTDSNYHHDTVIYWIISCSQPWHTDSFFSLICTTVEDVWKSNLLGCLQPNGASR